MRMFSSSLSVEIALILKQEGVRKAEKLKSAIGAILAEYSSSNYRLLGFLLGMNYDEMQLLTCLNVTVSSPSGCIKIMQ
jgi:hypothetical protein